MKVLMSVFVASMLSLAAMAYTQDTTKQSGSQTPQTDQSQAGAQSNQNTSQSMSSDASNPNQNMSGKVSNNGKTFTSDKGQRYQVDNPDTLTSYDNQQVGLIVHVDPDTGVIHIIQVQ